MDRTGEIRPKVSILIPTYNRAHYLSDAIDSALVQDYPNLEVIVSDNASADATRDVMARYAGDARVRYYRNDTNLGSSANYERLLYVYATGEFAKFLTDDDFLLDRRHVSRAMDIVGRHGVKVVFSAAASLYEGEETEARCLSLRLPEAVSRAWWLENLCRTIRGVHCFPSCGSGTVFEVRRAKDLDAARQGKLYNDYEFAVQCILLDPLTGYIQEPSYLERRHAGQDGRTSYANAVQGTMMFERTYQFGKALGLDEAVLSRLRFRGLRSFARGFLMPNWVREHGRSLASLRGFRRELAAFDRRLPGAVMFDVKMLGQFFIYDTALHRVIRRGYRTARSWSQGPAPARPPVP